VVRVVLAKQAKSAIETLKQEMDRLQHEVQRSHKTEADLRQQLQATATATATASSNFHVSSGFLDSSKGGAEHHLEALQEQLKMSRDATNAKDDALVSCQEELAETKMSLDHYGAVNAGLQKDNTRMTERLRDLSRRHDELDKEIVASRTSVDFNALQMSEKDRYIERLQDVIEKYEQDKKDYIHTHESEKVVLSTAEQRNLDALRTVHEKEILSLQTALQSQEVSLKEEIEKLIQVHSHEMEKSQHNSKVLLEKATLEHTTLVQQLKREDAGQSYSLREGLNEGIFEKEAEILRLQGVIELEKSHTETQKNINEELKKQLASQSNNLEGTSLEKTDYQRKHEAVASQLEVSVADSHKLQLVVDSLNLELQHERGSLVTLRQEFRESQSTISSLQSQVSSYESEIDTLKTLTGGVESNSRENERLKGLVQACKEDMVDMTAERDQIRMTEKITKEESLKKDEHIMLANAEVARLVTKIDEVTAELRASHQEINSERSNVVRLEAIIIEQRESSVAYKSELEVLRHDLSVAEQKVSTENFNSQTVKAGFERSCSLMLQALMKWDVLLVPTIEGDDTQGEKAVQKIDSHKAVDDILKNSDDLFQNCISVVERIQYKINRLIKIREMFGKSCKRMVSEVEKSFDAGQDKVSLMTYRVKELEERSKHIGNQIDKDLKRKEQNSQEMKSFQHTIVSEHVNELKESEERASSLSAQLKSEMLRSEELERDLLLLQDENSVLQSERYEIGQTENAVNNLSDKFQTMAESNRLMSLEIEERGQTINKNSDTIQALTSEKNALLAGVQRLTSQIEMRDTIMSEHESTVASLKTEVLQLQNRQINPALEKSILESQNVLKSSISSFNQQIHSDGEFDKDLYNMNDSAMTSAFLSDNAVASSIQSMFGKLSTFVSTVSALSKTSEQMLHKYENIQTGAGRQDKSSLEHEIFELLDANSRLSSKLLQLAIDFKRLSRKVLLQSNEEPEKYEGVYFDSTRKGAASKGGHESSEFKREAHSPSLEVDTFGKLRFREDVAVSPRGSSLGMDALASPYDSPAKSTSSAYTFTPTMSQQASSTASSGHQQYWEGSGSARGKTTGLHRSSQQYSQLQRGYTSPVSSPVNHQTSRRNSNNSVKFADSYSKLLSHDSHYNGAHSPNSSSQYSASQQQMNQHQHQQHQHQYQHQQYLQGSGGSFQPSYSHSKQSSSAPGNRLAKLGSDLQHLAGKLDSFNSSANSSSKVLRD
jgi:hypothetical protein